MKHALSALSYGVLALVLVATTHEAIGHGTACLILGHHIQLITTSIFQCDAQDSRIAIAGPLANVSLGLISGGLWAANRNLRPRLAFGALTIAGLSLLWESGYVVQAMILGAGDSYWSLYLLTPHPGLGLRFILGWIGGAVYLLVCRGLFRAYADIWPHGNVARDTARLVWLGIALGGLAALPYALAGHANSQKDLIDTIIESAVASLPLLIMRRGHIGDERGPDLRLNGWVLAMIAVLFAVFTATLGVGIRPLL